MNPVTFFLMFLSVVGGLIIGAIPGLNATMAMALITPLTFTMVGNRAFAILCAIYVGAISGGLYSAILLGIPGTPSSIATTFDGLPLARKGFAAKAIGTALISSFIGGTIGFIFLSTTAPLLSRFALKFGPHEYFAVSVLGLSTIASVISSSTLKGLISCTLGLFAGIVGLDLVVGVPRFNFDMVQLMGGFDILAILIGMFAIPQILEDITTPQAKLLSANVKRVVIPPFKELISYRLNFIRSSIIGTWIGLLPGAGGSIASLLAYDQARRASKEPEKFGKGAIEGVIASETANNAVIGGSVIPLLTLGIPGDTPAVVMLSALMIHGLQPGPLLFKTNPDLIYTIVLALYISNILMVIVGFWGAKYLINILKIPKYLLLPMVITMCFVGTFAVNQRMFDVWVMIFAGLLGYTMIKYGYPVAPAVLGVVLGPIIETNLRQAIQVSNIGFIEFFTRPISGIVIFLVLVNFLWPILRNVWKGKKKIKENISLKKKHKNPYLRANRITGIFLIIFSIFIYWQSGYIPQTSIESIAYGPSFYPKILAILMIFLASILVLFPDQDKNQEIKQEKMMVDKEKVKKVFIMIVLIMLYPIITPLVGFVTTTVLFLMTSFYYLGAKSIRNVFNYFVISVSLSIFIYRIFEKFFYVFLPHGLIF